MLEWAALRVDGFPTVLRPVAPCCCTSLRARRGWRPRCTSCCQRSCSSRATDCCPSQVGAWGWPTAA
jgi:hypothetical protein